MPVIAIDGRSVGERPGASLEPEDERSTTALTTDDHHAVS
jgi:hypothetical protein